MLLDSVNAGGFTHLLSEQEFNLIVLVNLQNLIFILAFIANQIFERYSS